MCFSLAWVQALLIDLVIIVAVVAIIKLLVPFLTSLLPAGGNVISGIINIVLWAVVAVFIIYIIFGLIGCISGHGFALLPSR